MNDNKNYKCKFCENYPADNDKKVCQSCISIHRSKLSTGWLIFWFLFGAGIGAVVYYLWKKNQQEEWDRENL